MQLCFATNNPNKLREIAKQLKGDIVLKSLGDIGCQEELPEEQETLRGNAHQKAAYVAENFKVNCFADDTGLEVEALDNEPGVYSARFAGPQRSDQHNMSLVLQRLKGEQNRKAQFRTVICLILNGQIHYFEGVAKGHIKESLTGSQGFGYDPIFVPEGHDLSFAEMSTEEKNAISHRGKAVRKLIDFLNKG